jgi:hypothetical protein
MRRLGVSCRERHAASALREEAADNQAGYLYIRQHGLANANSTSPRKKRAPTPTHIPLSCGSDKWGFRHYSLAIIAVSRVQTDRPPLPASSAADRSGDAFATGGARAASMNAVSQQ